MIIFAKGPGGDRVHVDETMSRLEYTCFVCGAPLIPNKGDVYRHHFKHKSGRTCTDSWNGTYSDSEWHFSWQERFPLQNRERVLELGATRHRADVVVGETIVEFQHSTLSKVQFDDRNAFYGDLGYKVVWLFDLQDAYARGEIAPKTGQEPGSDALPNWFVWRNPRQAFNAYDPRCGDIDLLFQLMDVDCGRCIVRVRESCEAGFEEFCVSSWLTADEFLAHIGLDARGCPEPNLTPLEPNPDYVQFREKYGVCLDAQQERAAQTVGGSTLLLAVPGSGKTTTMVARLGYLTIERGVDPRSVIAVTYGRDAANEMHTRFARQFRDEVLANAITFSTINALCFKIYNEWCGKNPNSRPKRKVDGRFAKKLLRDTYKELKKEYVSEGELTELETRVGWVKNSMLEPSELPWLEEGMPHFAEAYEKYCQGLRDARKMDFDDQMRFAKYALEHDGELLAKYQTRYRYWCVDEAQDTSRIQHYIIHMLASSEGSGSVFMVGDEDQCIYGYRGAYPKALLNFTFDYPNARTLRMETNYRSGEEIVRAARTFVAGSKGRIDKHMVSGRGPGSVVRVEEVGHRLDQFEAALELVREHQREGRGTLAVLYRNNETAVPLVDQLIREDVAFTLSGSANTFFTSPVVKDIKAFMKLALDPTDEESFMLVYKKGSASIFATRDATWACRNARRNGTSILEEFVKQMGSYRKGWQVKRDVPKAKGFASLVRCLAGLSPLEAIEHLLENGYGEWLEEHNKGTRGVELLKLVAAREQTIPSFLERLDFLSRSWDKERPNHRISDDLTLATTHSCKGCEFDKVIIIDAIEDIFPSSRKDSFDYGKDEARDWQEERRLFYVAMTRAKVELILLRPADEETPFVDEVRPRLVPASEVVPLSVPDPITERVMATSSPMPVQSFKSASDGQYNALQYGASTIPETWRADSVPKPAVSRYDVDTWDIIEDHGPSYQRVENGGMQAEITRGPAGKTIDLSVPWTDEQIRNLANHLGEYVRDCSEAAVIFDVSGPQRMHDILLDSANANGVTLRLVDAALIEVFVGLMHRIEKLENAQAVLLLRCWVPGGPSGNRRVLNVDRRSRRIILSAELYDD